MNEALAWVKEHPYATGAIVLTGGILFLIVRSGSSASVASGGNDAQVASIQAGYNIQMSQIQASQNVAQLQAQVQNNQIAAALAAAKISADTATDQAELAADVEIKGRSLQADIFKSMIEAGTKEQLSNNEVIKKQLDIQKELAGKAIDVSKMGNRGDVGTNQLALILGQGDIGSFNGANASQSMASSMMWASIFSSLMQGGKSILGGLL